MGTYDWRSVGWLRTGKDGKDYAYCEDCKKWTVAKSVGVGEYEERVCADCGETVLED